ncbi:hypothetical protein GCM10022281_01420 [Sphingomonas rosea]|uniref:DUF3833 family protein n=1 Tax=Sphingomonas rosea TaxID=335605 RepID=A0ABP7THT7_9SPHN
MGKRLLALLVLALLPLGACTAADELPAGTAPLDPIAFFTGASSGTATLRPVVGKASPVRVESEGTPTPDGLRLVQRITEGTKKPRTRLWIIQRTPGGYVSTLTDAKGPVSVTVRGPRAFIGYVTPGGMRIEQELALQPDGRTILNRLKAYRFGVRLATLDETIVKAVAK